MNTEICSFCLNQKTCEMRARGGAQSSDELFNGVQQKIHGPLECFFVSCSEGRLKAILALRSARAHNQTGLIPFGSDHKPFKDFGDLQGRFVINIPESDLNDLGLRHGDVVMKAGDGILKISNLFENKPIQIDW